MDNFFPPWPIFFYQSKVNWFSSSNWLSSSMRSKLCDCMKKFSSKSPSNFLLGHNWSLKIENPTNSTVLFINFSEYHCSLSIISGSLLCWQQCFLPLVRLLWLGPRSHLKVLWLNDTQHQPQEVQGFAAQVFTVCSHFEVYSTQWCRIDCFCYINHVILWIPPITTQSFILHLFPLAHLNTTLI